MLLLKEENFITDPNALRTAALDLTYYSAIDHPEKNSDIEWASDNCSYSTIEISDTEGIIEDTVKQIASHIESSIKDVDDENVVIDSYKAHFQYYIAHETEPYSHYLYNTGYLPDFKPRYTAILYIGISPLDCTLEFWSDSEEMKLNLKLPKIDLQNTTLLTYNNLAVMDQSLAHRIKPSSWGDQKDNSGLLLEVYLNTT